jgi:hypothetical protein
MEDFMSTLNNNGRRYLWATVLSACLNVVLFAYISLGFAQDQSDRGRGPLEADVRELRTKAADHDAELKAIEVSLEGIRQQLRELRDDVREIKEAVK